MKKKRGRVFVVTFAYSEGWLAHYNGKKFEQNPYLQNPNSKASESADWKKGYIGRDSYMEALGRHSSRMKIP